MNTAKNNSLNVKVRVASLAIAGSIFAGLAGPAAPAAYAQDTSFGTDQSAVTINQSDDASAQPNSRNDKQQEHISHKVSDEKKFARTYAKDHYGWGNSQDEALVKLWTKESDWNYHATNGSSGAYGIPQALPGSKMKSAGKDWRNNPDTQIEWGLHYIHKTYGSPANAWAHSQRTGWY